MAWLRALLVVALIGQTASAEALDGMARQPVADPVTPLGPRMPIRPRPPVPLPMPPPPPPDELVIVHRQVLAAMVGASHRVQACTDRFGVGVDRTSVTVIVGLYGTTVQVARTGGRRFQRCVNDVVTRAVGARYTRRRSVIVNYMFTLDAQEEWIDHRFSQPPPRAGNFAR